jgi:hypothetical protein
MITGAMIDWWDWWITTVVALPVAAVLLGLALFVKRREVTVALLLVGLVAIGVGVAAPFVMGKSMGDGPRLTATEFALRADENCRNLAKNPAANFGQPKPTPSFARKLDAFMPHFEQALARQGQLRPPASEETTAMHWMNAMAAVGHDFESMRDAAKQGDSAAFGAAGKRLSADAVESRALSKHLGQTYCFQG